MPTNFPTGSDAFNVPTNPGSTALSSAGTSARNHVQSHKDLGDTIVAMQVEATMANHAHDGVTARFGNKLLQANTHGSPDTDTATTSLHHTLGTGANQAAPGNHASLPAFASTHPATVAWPVGCIFIAMVSTSPATLLGVGTWSQVQDAFLIGADGSSYLYTGSVVNNAATHGHTIPDTDPQGSHSHSIASPTDTLSTHKHGGGTTGSSNAAHYHGMPSTAGWVNSYDPNAADNLYGGTHNDGSEQHSHTFGGSYSTYYDNGTYHTHAMSDYNYTGSHSHTISNGVTGSTHSHSVSTDTPSHIPPYQAMFVWRRTA